MILINIIFLIWAKYGQIRSSPVALWRSQLELIRPCYYFFMFKLFNSFLTDDVGDRRARKRSLTRMPVASPAASS